MKTVSESEIGSRGGKVLSDFRPVQSGGSAVRLHRHRRSHSGCLPDGTDRRHDTRTAVKGVVDGYRAASHQQIGTLLRNQGTETDLIPLRFRQCLDDCAGTGRIMDVNRIADLCNAVRIFSRSGEVIDRLKALPDDSARFADTDMMRDRMNTGMFESRHMPAQEFQEIAELPPALDFGIGKIKPVDAAFF